MVKYLAMYRVFLFLSVILFAFSLMLPVYADKPDLQGIMALLGGWMVALNDIPTAVSWLANVTFFFAVIMMLKKKKPKAGVAFVLGILSILFACFFLAAGKIVTGPSSSQVIGKLAIGKAFYAWIGSFVLISIAAWLKMKAVKSNENPPSDTGVLDSRAKS